MLFLTIINTKKLNVESKEFLKKSYENDFEINAKSLTFK